MRSIHSNIAGSHAWHWIGGRGRVGDRPMLWKSSSIVWKFGSIEWNFCCREWHVVQCARDTGGGRVFNPSVFGYVAGGLGVTDSRCATCPSSIPSMWVVEWEPRASICSSVHLNIHRMSAWRWLGGRGPVGDQSMPCKYSSIVWKSERLTPLSFVPGNLATNNLAILNCAFHIVT